MDTSLKPVLAQKVQSYGCMVCGSNPTKYYFSKTFNRFNLEKVDYFKCPDCGFVFAKSFIDMDAQTWERLNYEYHNEIFQDGICKDDLNWKKRLKAQSKIIKRLYDIGVLKMGH